ncbi:unnamed protein product, partial [Trichobilharzia regenti]
YVLVWDEPVNESATSKIRKINSTYRKTFEDNLQKAGVQIEKTNGGKIKCNRYTPSEMDIFHPFLGALMLTNRFYKHRVNLEDVKCSTLETHYLKLHIPWDLMCHHAECLNLRAPLEIQNKNVKNWSDIILRTLGIPNIMAQNIPNPPPDYYTCPFKKSKLNRFLGHDNPESYFSATQRHQVAYDILATQAYGSRERAQVGIDRLLQEEVYSAAYAIHEVSVSCHIMINFICLHELQV